MRHRVIMLGVVLAGLFSLSLQSSTEARPILRLMENKKYNIYDYGHKQPYHTFDRGWYSTRYPFNRYYVPQATSFQGFHEYNR